VDVDNCIGDGVEAWDGINGDGDGNNIIKTGDGDNNHGE